MTLRAILRAHPGLDDIAGEFLAGFSDPRFLWLGLGAPSGQNGQGDEAAARDALRCFARRLFGPALTAYGHLPFAVFIASPSLAAVTVDMISSPLVS